MVKLIDIDVGGYDVLSKGYSIIIIINQKEKHAYRFSEETQSLLKENFRLGNYNLNPRTQRGTFKTRVYAAAIVCMLRNIYSKKPETDDYRITACRDLSGHEEQIKRFLNSNLTNELPNIAKNIVFARHPREALINQVSSKIYNNNHQQIKRFDNTQYNN